MKLTIYRSDDSKPLSVPTALLELSGLGKESALEFRAEPGVLIALPARMTVMEMIRAVGALEELAAALFSKLALACDRCDDCGMCGEPDTPVCIPVHVLEEAGLPPDCKLTACVDEDGYILVEEADYAHDLTDVPEQLLDTFRKAGTCLIDLEDLLIREDIVYDATKKEEEYLWGNSVKH